MQSMSLVLRKAVLPKNVSLLKYFKGRPLATAANKKNIGVLSNLGSVKKTMEELSGFRKRQVAGMHGLHRPAAREKWKPMTPLLQSLSCPCIGSSRPDLPKYAVLHQDHYQHPLLNKSLPKMVSVSATSRPYKTESSFSQKTQKLVEYISSACAACGPCCVPRCGCCAALPGPCNTPPRCIQYMTGYYYYPYGFWFCGPYHVTGTCVPGGPVSPGGPCGPCNSPGGPCGPCNPGCVCVTLNTPDAMPPAMPAAVESILDDLIPDELPEVDVTKLQLPIATGILPLNCLPLFAPHKSRSRCPPRQVSSAVCNPFGPCCGPCCGPCGNVCGGMGPCGPCGPKGPFGPCGPCFPGVGCGAGGFGPCCTSNSCCVGSGCCPTCGCGSCGPPCGNCCGCGGCGCVGCTPCGGCCGCGSCGPCCNPGCCPCGPCSCCGPCGPLVSPCCGCARPGCGSCLPFGCSACCGVGPCQSQAAPSPAPAKACPSPPPNPSGQWVGPCMNCSCPQPIPVDLGPCPQCPQGVPSSGATGPFSQFCVTMPTEAVSSSTCAETAEAPCEVVANTGQHGPDIVGLSKHPPGDKPLNPMINSILSCYFSTLSGIKNVTKPLEVDARNSFSQERNYSATYGHSLPVFNSKPRYKLTDAERDYPSFPMCFTPLGTRCVPKSLDSNGPSIPYCGLGIGWKTSPPLVKSH